MALYHCGNLEEGDARNNSFKESWHQDRWKKFIYLQKKFQQFLLLLQNFDGPPVSSQIKGKEITLYHHTDQSLVASSPWVGDISLREPAFIFHMDFLLRIRSGGLNSQHSQSKRLGILDIQNTSQHSLQGELQVKYLKLT